MHTAAYLGPKGSVKAISNGLNCQNCHLDAGTKVFGNNYGSVAATYPKFRARSGQEEDIYKRVNDCFERSLNGKPLAVDSKEMQAIKAYIEFLGKDVPKGEKAKGSGFKDLAYLDRAADK
ncbi:MAG: cytochrome c class I, partial [Bacteroidetes bacterium OLB12]